MDPLEPIEPPLPIGLTDAEIEAVREICDLTDTPFADGFVIAKSLTADLNEAQVLKIKSDVEFWIKYRRKTLNLNGDGIISIAEDKLNRIRRFMRVMLGLPPISEVQMAIDDENGSSMEFGSIRMMSGRAKDKNNREFS